MFSEEIDLGLKFDEYESHLCKETGKGCSYEFIIIRVWVLLSNLDDSWKDGGNKINLTLKLTCKSLHIVFKDYCSFFENFL